MGFNGLLIKEIFYSIQGESSQSGLPFVFVRLSGCNLRCVYCDSAYAFKGGDRLSQNEVLRRVQAYPCKNVLITGGEPLLQRGTLPLVEALNKAGYSVSIETHGEVSIEAFATRARIIMDIKTPGSKMCRMGFRSNLRWLGPEDEVKFVVTSREDLEWSEHIIRETRWPTPHLLLSLAQPVHGVSHASLNLKEVAEFILERHLPVRLQTQLHKLIWGADTTGV